MVLLMALVALHWFAQEVTYYARCQELGRKKRRNIKSQGDVVIRRRGLAVADHQSYFALDFKH